MVLSVVHDNFPHTSHDAHLHASYVQNLFTLLTYMPSLRPSVLELIVDKMMQLDVCILLSSLSAAKLTNVELHFKLFLVKV